VTRVFVCVLDGAGAGELPDAAAYGDQGSSTLRHVVEASGVALPNLAALGLGEVIGLPLGAPQAEATYGRLLERGAGKDTTTGHWEMMGIVLERPFPTYPHGFPPRSSGLLRRPSAVGCSAMNRLRARRSSSGWAMSTCAAGAHRLHLGRLRLPDRLSRRDRADRAALRVVRDRPWHPARPARRGRVIARPFEGTSGQYHRTPRRRDFSLPPTGPTYLDLLHERNVPVVGVGKIGEIFVQRGVDVDDHTTDNTAGIAACARHLHEMDTGLLFANLVDFDMVWGHRNDVRASPAVWRRWTPPCRAGSLLCDREMP